MLPQSFPRTDEAKLTNKVSCLTPPSSLAIEDSTGDFYITAARAGPNVRTPPYVEVFSGEGVFLDRFGPSKHPRGVS